MPNIISCAYSVNFSLVRLIEELKAFQFDQPLLPPDFFFSHSVTQATSNKFRLAFLENKLASDVIKHVSDENRFQIVFFSLLSSD